MRQILFEIPGLGLKIFGYGLMLFFAFLGSMHLAARRARREGLDPEVIYDLALWVFVGGLVGARGFYVFQYWGTKGLHGFWDIFKIWEGGIVLYGSIMGGTATFFLYRALRPFPLRPMLDVIAPSLAFGVAIGRFGCFLNGCCYGDTCDLPWAVRFPRLSPPWEAEVARNLIPPGSAYSLPLHPTQLYSTLDGLILFALLTAFYPLRRRDGAVMGLLMVTYPITRFLIERLRDDEGAYFAGLTISQAISVGLLAGGLIYCLALTRLPAGRYVDIVKPEHPEPVLDGATILT
ncbi:prolipoprotein diacylglyceryl transferase [Tundrisphaera sp. TA3]|uniref:prolipoprotein diacylglyceryl transferase n=1 Tax=Tundrisphaera sp. TA3 TaxID=3435775 RepID=UPI003EBE5F31